MAPLLSIIIPTKNRYEYLKEVLKILNNFNNDQIEIVVQDNSEEGEPHDLFLIFLAELNDVRIKYYYYSGHLSINENSDRAVLNSDGKYVTFIGDDDCVAPQIIKAVEWMEKESIEVLTFNCPSYIWPDIKYKYLGKKHIGLLTYEKPTGNVEVKTPILELHKLLGKGGQSLKELPQLYHGIVSRTSLNKIYSVGGSYFPGSVPDMDVAIGLSLFSTKHYRIDVPIIIAGTARKSAGGLGAAKMHKGDVRENPTLPKDTADTWNPFNPFFWSGPTIYADSVYKCLIRMGHEDLLQRFNYNYLYAKLFTFFIGYFSEIQRIMRKNKKTSYLKIFYYVFLMNTDRAKFFLRNRIPFLFPDKYQRLNFSSITEVVGHLEEVINKMQLPWQTIS